MTSPHRIRNAALATVGLLLLGATVVAAQPSLLPDRAPAYGARDRHELPEGNSTLTLHVGFMVNGTAQPADGVSVIVHKLTRDRPHHEEFARGVTASDGSASFELPNGFYGVVAEKGPAVARKMVRLADDKDMRLMLHEKGGHQGGHQDGPYALGVRALYRSDEGPQPAAGAAVVLERYVPGADSPRNGTWEQVATGTTDANGLWTTVMERGGYRVSVTDGSGLEGHRRGILHHDSWVRVGLSAAEPEPDQ